MAELQTLDTVNIALSGTKLIEASAGTGKTYAITGLYIRLLLEQELDVASILVVTFTEAATKELRERIRSRLQDALAVYENGTGPDEFLTELYAKHRGEGRSIKQCRQRLILALHSLDLASIYTIHGFCARVLQESAFESGLLFDLDLSENDSDLLGQIIDDYWRGHIGQWQDLFVQYLFGKKINADTLFSKLQGVVSIARAVGLHRIDSPPHVSPAQFHFSPDSLAALWQQSQQEIIDLLASPALSKAKKEGYHPDNVARWEDEISRFFEGGENRVLPINAFEKLSYGGLAKGTKASKIGETPEHLFFEQSELLVSQLAQALHGLYRDIIENCLEELPKRKSAAGVLSFDDLLLCVRDGLRDKRSGNRLPEKIREQYQALLIDEFQDTDAVQYEIFQTVYGSKENPLFLIGDPKQAIYRFRGADIYAYLKAVKTAGNNVYGMDTNWRSEPDLVHGFNMLFGFTKEKEPFLIPEIQYHHVKPSRKHAAVLSVEGEVERPLSFMLFSEQMKKGNAKKVVAGNLAQQIKKLIALGREGKASFNTCSTRELIPEKKEQLSAGHMAVLVRSHKDGELIRSALAEQGIRSVLHSRHEVFFTNEAREFQTVLAGVLRPTDGVRLKTALSTSLMGWQADALKRLDEDESLWERTVEHFYDYQKLWEIKGFAVMVFRLLRREKVTMRIAGCRNGERRLTNMRHIVEILQEVSHQERFGPAALFDWFKKQRHVEEKNEERQLRLESDESLVKIVTIHKSKGLEYPIVFCPFLWDSPHSVRKDKGWVPWHDVEGTERVDFGTDTMDERYSIQKRETFAEEFRLLYVALTRARNRCYIYWGNVLAGKRPVTTKSALYALLSSYSPPEQSESFGDKTLSLAGNDQFFDPIYAMAAFSPKSVSVSESDSCTDIYQIDAEPPQELISVPIDFRVLEPSWNILSFSALLRLEKDVNEEPDHDTFFSPQEKFNYPGDTPDISEQNMFHFPKGALAGSCLHDIFEKLDFSAFHGELATKIVEDSLDMYGINREWSVPLLRGLDSILQTGLDSEKDGFCLNQIGMEQRINEMEFYYSIPKKFIKEFQSIFHGSSGSMSQHETGMGKGELGPVWYMKGFIDLIFEWQGQYYIVDYKSNFLGYKFEDYNKTRLKDEMLKAGYDMQYHIYLVALHRYLQKRVPGYDYDSHMGGVYYLFIRGMSPESGPEFGVFKDLPEREVIEAMERRLRCDG